MNDILKELKKLADPEYNKFNKRIVATQQHTIGVRLPELRRIAKRIAKENPYTFIESGKGNWFELIMLEGLVLSYMNESFLSLLPHTENFLQKVDSWAQIDTTIGKYKNIKKEKNDIIPIVKKWLKSKDEFVVRAGLIMLLCNYVTAEYLDMIFRLSANVKHKGYYVSMGNAWLIAECMAKFPDQTIEFLKQNKLDAATHNRAIQKARDSFRVSKENKELLKNLKRT